MGTIVRSMALLLVGCAAQATQMEPCPDCNGKPSESVHAPERLIRRAAFDLQCDKAQVRFTALEQETVTHDPQSWGATGCGKQATYVSARGCALDDCTWVMNGVIQPTK